MADNNRPYDLKHHYYMYDIGWLIDKIQAVSDELGQAIDLRTIHYADPINWDITTQYQANTVVVDNNTGVAYISSKNVPAGVLLTNTEYWNPIFNYNDAINKLMGTIAYNEQDSPTATAAHAKGSFIYSNAVLYQAIKDISDGDALKVGANMQLVTLSDAINTAIEAVIAAAREAVNDESTTRAEADAALSKRIDAEATARADADANYTGTNKVSTVTNDDTRTAGDITDTADNIVIHGKRSVLMDSDGTYTEDITGKKKVNADNIEETYQTTRSIHVVGEQTEAVDSNATKSIGGTYSKIVTGITTEKYNAARKITGTNQVELFTGLKNVTAKDIAMSADSIKFKLPKGEVDLSKIAPLVDSNCNIVVAGADNTGATAVDDIFDTVLAEHDIVYMPAGTYLFTRQHAISGKSIIGCGAGTKIKTTSFGLNEGINNQYGGFNSQYKQMLFRLNGDSNICGLTFKNIDAGAIVIWGDHCTISNCYMSSLATISGSTGYYAIVVRNCSDIHINNITIDMLDGNNRDGIHIEALTHEIYISNCWIKAGDDGIAFNALEGDGGPIHDIFVSNCRIGGYGVRFFGEEHTDIYHIVIDSCYIIVDSDTMQSGCIRFGNTTNTIGGTPIGDHGIFRGILISNCILNAVKSTNLTVYTLNAEAAARFVNCIFYQNIYYENTLSTSYNFVNCQISAIVTCAGTSGSNTLSADNCDISGVYKATAATLIFTATNCNISTLDCEGDSADAIRITNSYLDPENIVLSSRGSFEISNTKVHPSLTISVGAGAYYITNLIDHAGGVVIQNAGEARRITGGIRVNALPTAPGYADYVIFNNQINIFLDSWVKVTTAP